MLNRPVYTIGIVSEFVGAHPETIRTWERAGLFQPPQRRGGKRFYSEHDLKRLQFIQKLAGEGLTPTAILHYLQLYPCWQMDDCPECMSQSPNPGCTKPCWKEDGTYCQVSSMTEDLCAVCPVRHEQGHTEVLVSK